MKFKYYRLKCSSIFLSFIFYTSISFAQGLHGYISSSSSSIPAKYNYGAGFYSAIWPLIPSPVEGFQIGLPGTWLIPNNIDNKTIALCPAGTRIRNYPEWGPTYDGVFQTIEGSPGYWVNQRFHYPSPKFMMNSTPNCYNQEIATPGFSFFGSNSPLSDTTLGIAQLSNRLLVPPDGLTFSGNPTGELLGFSYMALPLTNAYTNKIPIGENNWTLFLNTKNFKGPIAYYVPEVWAKISQNYSFDENRGLDSRLMNTSWGLGGTMEINTVPWFSGKANGTNYHKIPSLQFPVDSTNTTILSLDVTFYSATTIYNDILTWRNGGQFPSGKFASSSAYKPTMKTSPVTYDQNGTPVTGINSIASPVIIGGNAFCLKWSASSVSNGFGKFPQYYKDSLGNALAIDSISVPFSTGLASAKFASPNPNPSPYEALLIGAWATPGPSAGPFQVVLADNSLVTYYWYRFINQPVFQQFNWTLGKKDSLQRLVEAIHTNWSITQDYIAAPSSGSLVSFDSHLLVSPPSGLEIGYVPIVTKQEKALLNSAVHSASNSSSQTEKIFPVPSTGIITIQNLDDGISNILVLNLYGESIYNSYNNSITDGKQTNVDLSTKPKGIYFIQITNGKSITTKKIILE